jgi:hypothetical protein
VNLRRLDSRRRQMHLDEPLPRILRLAKYCRRRVV